MMQQAQTRQPDETICFRCGNTVKRDAGTCSNCGSRITAGPQHAAAVPIGARYTPGLPGTAPSEDVVGAGRYILNFLLAGVIGLVLTYVMRRQGWMATYICAPIFIVGVVIVLNAH